MAAAPTLRWLFVGRVLSGITSASITAATAYISDVTPAGKRARAFGLIGAAFGIGFVLGPALGGWLGAHNPRLPFWVAAAFSLLNALYGLLVLPESLAPEKRQRRFRWEDANPLGSLKLLRSHTELLGLAAVNFLGYVAHEVYATVFVLYATSRYHWGERAIGGALALVGVSSMLISAAVVGPVVARIGERRTLFAGLLLGAIGFVMFGWARQAWLFLAAIPINCLWGLAGPPSQSMMTQRVSPSEQGELQGALGSVRSIAMLVGPGIFAVMFATFIAPERTVKVPGAPWYLAAGLLIVAAALARAVVAKAAPVRKIERGVVTAGSLLVASVLAAAPGQDTTVAKPAIDVWAVDRGRILRAAAVALDHAPLTVTAATSPRSAGGPHDYFSEADYWWPDPANPGGPFIQRDGMSNPDNFDAHRQAMRRLSVDVPALVAAWKLTGDARYAQHAVRHLRAWFVDEATRMSPHLRYAQAIQGRVTGRGTGIIDTLHLVEVARAVEALAGAPGFDPATEAAVRGWFGEYVRWMTTDKNGIEERDARNNHGTCWALQAAAFARLAGDEPVVSYCRDRFKTVLLPNQMAADGSFPEELRRTKPYGYSLFNLEAMAGLCQLLSTLGDDLWRFTLPDGRGMRRGMEFMVPYIRDKKSWPKPPDVMYDREWPMRQASLLFAGLAFSEPSYLERWRTLPADSTVDEVIRNFFIRQPVLWIGGEAPRSSATKRPDPAVVVTSPRKNVEISVQSADGGLAYRVRRAGKPVIETSPLGILVDGVDLGQDARLVRVERYSTNERYPWRGVHSEAVDRSEGARLRFAHARAPEGFVIELRAFDDAAAFRFVVPGRGPRVPDAASSFRLPAGSTVWYHGARDHYEGIHQRKDVAEIAAGDWAAPPVTFRLPEGGGYASITEAALRAYAGMMLQADGHGAFAERLGHAVPASYPYTLRYGEDNARRLAVAAAVDGAITTPWRVVLAGPSLDALVSSDAIHDLAPPPDPKLFPQGMRTSWLRPGRAVWRYLDGGGDCDKGPQGPERDQCLFPVIEDFSRLAGELGFEHQVVEGMWRRWSDEQIQELVDVSRRRNVSIWLWIHRKDLGNPEERRRLFARLHGLGVSGVKVDFFDHEAREVVDLYEAILKDAAEAQLLVDFHGANKPTGLERTWPNEMTREGVRGLEYRSTPGWAVHNTTLPFTRFLAGPADYTPVVLGDRRKDTTWAHQVATAVVFTSPVLIYGGHPQSLLDNPAAPVIKAIPSVWDETHVLPSSEIGELAVYARRTGDAWFVGVLNGKEPRTLRLPLSFLGKGRYHATLVSDDRANGAAVHMDEREVTARDVVDISLRDGGGFVGRFSR